MSVGIPMSWNGTSGYFLNEDEYETLVDAKPDDYVEELEIEVGNHRNTLDEARSTAYDLYKFLDNAL